MTQYPSIQKKIDETYQIIKEENRKPKSERRNDLHEIKDKNQRMQRWMKELINKT